MIQSGDLIIFCDFDGTFAETDIGHRVFKHFSNGKNLELVKRWKRLEISSRECLAGEAEMIRLTEAELYSYIDQFDLRRGAREFYGTIKSREIPFAIVSDGTDLYIRYILDKNGLGEIEFYCNRGKILNGRLSLEFPYDNDGCPRCGSCKGARMKEILDGYGKKPQTVFIGDGLSDICALEHANFIFARGDLLDYCRKHNYEAFEYNDFFDILKNLQERGLIE